MNLWLRGGERERAKEIRKGVGKRERDNSPRIFILEIIYRVFFCINSLSESSTRDTVYTPSVSLSPIPIVASTLASCSLSSSSEIKERESEAIGYCDWVTERRREGKSNGGDHGEEIGGVGCRSMGDECRELRSFNHGEQTAHVPCGLCFLFWLVTTSLYISLFAPFQFN